MFSRNLYEIFTMFCHLIIHFSWKSIYFHESFQIFYWEILVYTDIPTEILVLNVDFSNLWPEGAEREKKMIEQGGLGSIVSKFGATGFVKTLFGLRLIVTAIRRVPCYGIRVAMSQLSHLPRIACSFLRQPASLFLCWLVLAHSSLIRFFHVPFAGPCTPTSFGFGLNLIFGFNYFRPSMIRYICILKNALWRANKFFLI